jgi:glutamate synthase domain-containing protein 3
MSPGLEETENTYRVRQENPDKYEKFRVKEISEGIKFVLGKVKDKDKWEVQSIIFDKDKFDKEKVRKWVKEHGYKISSIEKQLEIWAKETEFREKFWHPELFWMR